MRVSVSILALLAFAVGCSRAPEQGPEAEERARAARSVSITPVRTEAPSGYYRLDKAHASLVFKVDHIGYSSYTGEFDNFDATLRFDPAAPESMSVSAIIDVASLDVPSPPEGFLDEIKGPAWLDAIGHPKMEFKSTNVALTSPDSARIDGELTFRGVTAPVAMEATFNGGYAGFPPYDPNARIGFSAKGALKRSDYGISSGLPTDEMPGVGDDVTFEIEAEFNGPPETPPPAPAEEQ